MRTVFAFLALGFFCGGSLSAAEPLGWSRFRGPGGSGVADGQKPPVEFGPERNVKWKIPAPSGLSSPIVAGDKLFITGFEDGKLWTIAYRRTTGEEAWRSRSPPPVRFEPYHKTEGSPAASTPATDGKRIVSYFGSCGLVCYDLAGAELWRFELPPATVPGDFGSGVSPIIEDGIVILVRDELKNPRIYAIDAATGLAKWDNPRQSLTSYCTPVLWDTPGGKQIAAAGHARMIGYDLRTGAEKWSVGGVPSGCCTSPVTANGLLYFAGWSPGGADESEFQMPKYDDLLKQFDADRDGALSRGEGEQAFQGFFDNQDTNRDGKVTREEYESILKFMSEGQNSAFALKPGGTGDVTSSHVLWKRTKGLPYIASAIVYRGQCVMVKDGGIVTACDAQTGSELYQARVAASGKYYASPVAANGHIYFTSLDGVVTVIKAGEKQPVVVARNQSLEKRTAATPALADDTLYMRTETHLYAFAEPAGK
jgi:outer membrane protein assembly factor BamB